MPPCCERTVCLVSGLQPRWTSGAYYELAQEQRPLPGRLRPSVRVHLNTTSTTGSHTCCAGAEESVHAECRLDVGSIWDFIHSNVCDEVKEEPKSSPGPASETLLVGCKEVSHKWIMFVHKKQNLILF